MYIKKIECKSFAGINGISKELQKGMNVILGDNESGKSTLTDFLYHILFTSHDVSYAEVEGKSFRARSFPIKTDGSDPSSIEGSLKLEIDGEEYEINKTWSKESGKKVASCKLNQPNKTLNAEEAEAAIRGILRFGSGTYRETVFSSQRESKRIVEMLLAGNDNQNDMVSDFSQALANAFLETPSVLSSKLLKDLESTIDPYKKGWDIEKEEPKGKAVKEETAAIRPLYDEWKSIKDDMEGVESAENEYEVLRGQVLELEKELSVLEENLIICRKYSELRKEKDYAEQKASDIKAELNLKKKTLLEWPRNIDSLRKAEDYDRQLADANIVSRYNAVKELKDKYEEEVSTLKALKKVEQSDIDCLQNLINKIEAERNKLGGMNIDLDISEIDESLVKLSYYDGEDIVAKANSHIEVSRAVNIDVSDKLKMQIRPRNTDIGFVLGEIEKAKRDFEKKCAEFSCETIEMVKDLKDKYEKQEKKAHDAEGDYNRLLESYHTTWLALQEERKSVPSEQERDAVVVHVNALLNEVEYSDKELGQLISDLRARISRNNDEFVSVENLESHVKEQQQELDKLEKRINEIVIPEEIEKLDEEKIKARLDSLRTEIETIRHGELNDARLKIVEKKPLATYRAEIAEIEHELETEKREGRRWYEIQKRLMQVKSEASQMDVTSLKDNFTRYLHMLTSERVSVDDLSSTLELTLASDDNLLNETILSNGTRETIELAFRLAMLDELFPDGDGFAVFDDSLVNMDPDRTRKACEALKEFAKKNQVIFVTCHPEYVELLGVEEKDVIRM